MILVDGVNFMRISFAGLPIWRPGASLMRQMRFPGKMLLISAAFLLPVAWLSLVYGSAKRDELNFVARERAGIRYAQGVYSLISAATVWRFEVRSAAMGAGPDHVDEARKTFEAALETVTLLDQHLGQSLGTTEALHRATEAAREAQVPTSSAKAIFEAMNNLTGALVSLQKQVTDGSKLALDPELATSHLIAATLSQPPAMIRDAAEVRGLGRTAFKAGSLGLDAAARLQGLVAVLNNEKQKMADHLATLRQVDPAHAQNIQMQALGSLDQWSALLASSFPLGQSEVSGDVIHFLEVSNAVIQSQLDQALQNLKLLDSMLVDRQLILQRHVLITGLWTLICLWVAFYLFMGCYLAMSDGFKLLRQSLIGISMGDLRASVTGKGRDEVAGLLKELGYMQTALSDIVRQVQQASEQVVLSSTDIAQGTTDLSARTESAAAALEESSAALEQTTSTIQLTAESVRRASEIAQDNARTAERGGQVMLSVAQTMEHIQGSSQRISDIIGVIDGIAFQTNILALNAAVEAARAGEQGRGFAVVASEVRALAGRSAVAAKEIKSLISSSSEEVRLGTDVVRLAGQTMKEIVCSADNVKSLLDEVANGAREQSQGIAQIGAAVQELDRNTQANAALVEQTATSAGLQRQAAVKMASTVDEFRLPGQQASALIEGVDIDAIIDGHRQWKVKLRTAIEDRELVDTAMLSRDDCCALGKWIYGDGQRLANRASFSELLARHATFHIVAGQVGDMINQRHMVQAEDALAPGTSFSNATAAVVSVLSSIKRLGF